MMVCIVAGIIADRRPEARRNKEEVCVSRRIQQINRAG